MSNEFAPLNARLTIETMPPDARGRSEALPTIPETGIVNDDVFEALLYPNRSLPNRGFIVLMTIVIGVNVSLGIMFTMIGAWPVLAFGGLDIALVYLAFRISYRQGRLHERVRLTSDRLDIARVLPSGHEMRWSLSLFWTTITIENAGSHHCAVVLRTRGKSLLLGSFLSPKERADFGRTLQEKLSDARSGS